MRIESSVTSVSWIPSEAVTGPVLKGTFESGFTHYDDPPPDAIDDLEALARRRPVPLRQPPRGLGRGRGRPHRRRRLRRRRPDGRDDRAPGQAAGHVRAGRAARPPAGARDRSDTEVRFVQTTGGRTGLPAPRRVKHPPFVQFQAPTVWTTLALTIHADGTSDVRGARREQVPAPLGLRRRRQARGQGRARRLQGLVPRRVRQAHARGATQDSQALVTAVETALERQLSATIMRGGEQARDPHGQAGQVPRRAGRPGRRLFLLLDGVLVGDRSTASRSPSSAPARSSASAPCSKAACAPRRSQASTDVPGRGGAAPTRSTATRCSSSREGHRRADLTSSGNVRRVRIATWNVNSLKARQERVEEWLEYAAPDVLCLQETKLADDAFPHLALLRRSATTRCTTGRASGTASRSCRASASTTSPPASTTTPSTRTRATPGVLAATCGGVRVVSVYVPNGREVGTEFYDRKLVGSQALHDWLAATSVAGRRPRRPRRLQRRTRGPRRVVAEGVRRGDPRHRARARGGRARSASGAWSTCSGASTPTTTASSATGTTAAATSTSTAACASTSCSRREPLADRITWAVVDRNARKGKQPSDHAPRDRRLRASRRMTRWLIAAATAGQDARRGSWALGGLVVGAGASRSSVVLVHPRRRLRRGGRRRPRRRTTTSTTTTTHHHPDHHDGPGDHHDRPAPADHRRPAELRRVPVRRVAERRPDRRGQRRQHRRGERSCSPSPYPAQGPYTFASCGPAAGSLYCTWNGQNGATLQMTGPHPHRRAADPGARTSSSPDPDLPGSRRQFTVPFRDRAAYAPSEGTRRSTREDPCAVISSWGTRRCSSARLLRELSTLTASGPCSFHLARPRRESARPCVLDPGRGALRRRRAARRGHRPPGRARDPCDRASWATPTRSTRSPTRSSKPSTTR